MWEHGLADFGDLVVQTCYWDPDGGKNRIYHPLDIIHSSVKRDKVFGTYHDVVV